MTISQNFNSFYHVAVLTELFKKANSLKFELWVDDETGGEFIFYRDENYSDVDELKQLLKNMNLDYAVDGDKKISTSDISSKALSQHIEWCIRLAGFNGIEFEFVKSEWDRLLANNGIHKEY